VPIVSIAFRFAKNNFHSIHARKSIRIDSSDSIRLHMVVTQKLGGRGQSGSLCTACSLTKYGWWLMMHARVSWLWLSCQLQ